MPLERFSYCHIETGAHEVILAEGTPTETLYDYGGCQVFDNEGENTALTGGAEPVAEMDLPHITSPQMLPDSIVGQVAERAEQLGKGARPLVT